jgi:hypothetical protein
VYFNETGEPSTYSTWQDGTLIVRSVFPGRYSYLARIGVYRPGGEAETFESVAPSRKQAITEATQAWAASEKAKERNDGQTITAESRDDGDTESVVRTAS